MAVIPYGLIPVQLNTFYIYLLIATEKNYGWNSGKFVAKAEIRVF